MSVCLYVRAGERGTCCLFALRHFQRFHHILKSEAHVCSYVPWYSEELPTTALEMLKYWGKCQVSKCCLMGQRNQGATWFLGSWIRDIAEFSSKTERARERFCSLVSQCSLSVSSAAAVATKHKLCLVLVLQSLCRIIMLFFLLSECLRYFY